MLSMNGRRKLIGGWNSNLSWRFFPDPDDDPAKEVVKEEADFDKDRQKQDQDAANQRKYQQAQAQAEEARQQAEKLAQEKAELQQKLDDLQLKADEQGITIPELNEEDYQEGDVNIVKAIKALQSQLEVKSKRLQNLEKVKDDLMEERRVNAEVDARNTVYNNLLDDLDTEYGAQHRNAAVAAFDKLIKDSKVPKGNPTKATRIMEKCYRDAAKAAKDKEKFDGSVNLDTGSGGNAPGGMSSLKLKPGSLNQVIDQVQASINSS